MYINAGSKTNCTFYRQARRRRFYKNKKIIISIQNRLKRTESEKIELLQKSEIKKRVKATKQEHTRGGMQRREGCNESVSVVSLKTMKE